MFKRIVAIGLIFVFTSVAWLGLAALIQFRTQSAYRGLWGEVAELWGGEHHQRAPRIHYRQGSREVEVIPSSSRIAVSFDLDQRKKGLLWYSTYGVDFSGSYTFTNPTDEAREFFVTFVFPTPAAIYDGFRFVVDGQEVDVTDASKNEVETSVVVGPGETVPVHVSYRSRGLDRWYYSFGEGVSQVKDFRLEMTTDFKAIDFPARTISPSFKEEIPGGWRLVWEHENLISGFQLGMEMPKRLNPGPLASQITLFAPVSLLFFFFIVFILSVLRDIRIHPMNYFFLAAAFFSFHLLFAYLVDHIDVHVAFVLSSLVSVGLVVSYLRLVVGPRFAFVEAGLAQFIYLVLFSYAHFFKGFTGLTVTVLSIATLFVLMQLTGRIDWEEKFRNP